MPISDKVRKILWGRSGNRCAMCRRELVVDQTEFDDESVIGDECHIVSGKDNGPRFSSSFPTIALDDLDNLILLCRTHHKMVDDQVNAYPVDRLLDLKIKHEQWVSTTLAKTQIRTEVKWQREPRGTPLYLLQIASGSAAMAMIGGCCRFQFQHDEPQNETEAELIGNIAQETQDCGDVYDVTEPADRVKMAFRISQLIQELDKHGFRVFGGVETRYLLVEKESRTKWPVMIMEVLRKTNPRIVRISPEHLKS